MNEVQAKIKEIKNEYTVKNGIIRNPGKFEGESIAAVYYHEIYMNGRGDYFMVTPEERESFGIEFKIDYALILIADDGSVHLEYAQSESHAEDRVREWYNDDEDLRDD